jgi:iron complex transport system substrate-binding protein
MKIVSFLPSATEIVFALGLDKELFAVTFKCDYPPEARQKSVIVRPAVDMAGMTQNEIDQTVREQQNSGNSIYRIDEEALHAIQPDIILTQNLCQVCAPSEKDLMSVCQNLASRPQIIDLSPSGLEDIFDDIQRIGDKCLRPEAAQDLIRHLQERVKKICREREQMQIIPRVLFLEWLDPLFSGGHWVPEMIEMAGGRDIFAKAGEKSRQIKWQDALDFKPEIILLSPCGMNLEKCVSDSKLLLQYPHLDQTPAFQNAQIYAVDANAYFARPGPRVVSGIEILAKIFHPEIFEDLETPADSSSRLFLNR